MRELSFIICIIILIAVACSSPSCDDRISNCTSAANLLMESPQEKKELFLKCVETSFNEGRYLINWKKEK